MLHRTFPIMQLSQRRFDNNWIQKWQLLDDNFRCMEESLAAMGKKIGSVFIAFIDAKFPFDPKCCFDTHVKT